MTGANCKALRATQALRLPLGGKKCGGLFWQMWVGSCYLGRESGAKLPTAQHPMTPPLGPGIDTSSSLGVKATKGFLYLGHIPLPLAIAPCPGV